MRTKAQAILRQEEMLKMLDGGANVSVRTFSERLKCSYATVRNDLAYLEERGLVLRTHGGAIRTESAPVIGIRRREVAGQGAKRDIARRAFESCVREGMTLILDSGTTNVELARVIASSGLSLTVLTHSAPAMRILAGADILNQGLGGQVFQPDSLMDLHRAVTPELIIVAFGANYRYERCAEGQVAADVRAYLRELAHAWPGASTWVITPTWHDEAASPSHERSCWRQLPTLLADAASRTGMRLVDGQTLLDDDTALLADGCEHPNATGAAQLSDRLHAALCPPADEGDGAQGTVRE